VSENAHDAFEKHKNVEGIIKKAFEHQKTFRASLSCFGVSLLLLTVGSSIT